MKNRTLAGVLCGLATVAGSLMATVPTAHAATDLGGVSVARYCADNFYSGNPYVATKAINNSGKWDGWRCATAYGALYQVDMNQACRQQYPKSWWRQPDASANHTSSSAYSWRCYR